MYIYTYTYTYLRSYDVRSVPPKNATMNVDFWLDILVLPENGHPDCIPEPSCHRWFGVSLTKPRHPNPEKVLFEWFGGRFKQYHLSKHPGMSWKKTLRGGTLCMLERVSLKAEKTYESTGSRIAGGAWRIIPVSKWLITMVSKSPKRGYSLYKWPKCLVNRGY